jgi:hypothetical protein
MNIVTCQHQTEREREIKFTCQERDQNSLHTKLKTSVKTNSIGKLLRNKIPLHNNTYLYSAVYRLTCSECKKWYIWQSGRKFSTWYKNSWRFYNNYQNSNFLHTSYKVNTQSTSLTIPWKSYKPYLNTLETYYIYEETKNNNQLNDQNTSEWNTIFSSLSQLDQWTTNSHPLPVLSNALISIEYK